MIESFQNQQKETNKVIKVIKVLWVHPLQYARSVTQDHYAFWYRNPNRKNRNIHLSGFTFRGPEAPNPFAQTLLLLHL